MHVHFIHIIVCLLVSTCDAYLVPSTSQDANDVLSPGLSPHLNQTRVNRTHVIQLSNVTSSSAKPILHSQPWLASLDSLRKSSELTQRLRRKHSKFWKGKHPNLPSSDSEKPSQRSVRSLTDDLFSRLDPELSSVISPEDQHLIESETSELIRRDTGDLIGALTQFQLIK